MAGEFGSTTGLPDPWQPGGAVEQRAVSRFGSYDRPRCDTVLSANADGISDAHDYRHLPL